jgi:tripartite-type tricarboxylate transporter receptor subunit TctC
MRGTAPLALLASLALTGPAHAQPSEADFFRGKTISLGVPSSVGGGYDTYARLVARHYSRYVPGNPAVVTRNLPAAGGLVLANALYSSSPRDGTSLAIVRASGLYEELFGNPAVKFEALKFNWLGNMNSTQDSCVFASAVGLTSPRDLYARSAVVGASGVGAMAYSLPTVYNDVLGMKFKVVMGYPGTPERMIAMERGEIEGGCGMTTSLIKSTLAASVRDGKIRIVFQAGLTKDADFPDVPNVLDEAKTPEQRQALEFLFGQLELDRALAAPPDLPPGRVEALRRAFNAMFGDGEFLDEVRALKLDFRPLRGEETAEVVCRLFATPKPAVDKVRAALSRKAEP